MTSLHYYYVPAPMFYFSAQTAWENMLRRQQQQQQQQQRPTAFSEASTDDGRVVYTGKKIKQ